eukprot:gene24709-10643_t
MHLAVAVQRRKTVAGGNGTPGVMGYVKSWLPAVFGNEDQQEDAEETTDEPAAPPPRPRAAVAAASPQQVSTPAQQSPTLASVGGILSPLEAKKLIKAMSPSDRNALVSSLLGDVAKAAAAAAAAATAGGAAAAPVSAPSTGNRSTRAGAAARGTRSDARPRRGRLQQGTTPTPTGLQQQQQQRRLGTGSTRVTAVSRRSSGVALSPRVRASGSNSRRSTPGRGVSGNSSMLAVGAGQSPFHSGSIGYGGGRGSKPSSARKRGRSVLRDPSANGGSGGSGAGAGGESAPPTKRRIVPTQTPRGSAIKSAAQKRIMDSLKRVSSPLSQANVLLERPRSSLMGSLAKRSTTGIKRIRPTSRAVAPFAIPAPTVEALDPFQQPAAKRVRSTPKSK